MTLFEKMSAEPFLIAGPCVIESRESVFGIARELKKITEERGITFIFKASFDKANRTSVGSFRGPRMEKGLEILAELKSESALPILTDIHEAGQAEPAAEVADILQIPAFLCRQTDLLLAAGETGKIINIKKAQFLSGPDMQYPAQKTATTGNSQIMLTERGNIFGNNDLVVDFRNLVEMQKLGYPVIIDATHSVQKPGGAGGKSGGNREYAPFIAKAAAAVGVRGFFFETHPEPEKALSDGPNMIPLAEFGAVLDSVWRHIDA